mmetsp:Transcript_37379/g.78295  ORF Transcript_37379/g.78295 Transcript_37379/m.78295 type:complete len:260 (+) Transcript_37379:1401-2180(+)
MSRAFLSKPSSVSLSLPLSPSSSPITLRRNSSPLAICKLNALLSSTSILDPRRSTLRAHLLVFLCARVIRSFMRSISSRSTLSLSSTPSACAASSSAFCRRSLCRLRIFRYFLDLILLIRCRFCSSLNMSERSLASSPCRFLYSAMVMRLDPKSSSSRLFAPSPSSPSSSSSSASLPSFPINLFLSFFFIFLSSSIPAISNALCNSLSKSFVASNLSTSVSLVTRCVVALFSRKSNVSASLCSCTASDHLVTSTCVDCV